MARAYSLDLRERVVGAVAAGQLCRPVGSTFAEKRDAKAPLSTPTEPELFFALTAFQAEHRRLWRCLLTHRSKHRSG